jgi:cytochrome c-type biogenesis protein CcmH
LSGAIIAAIGGFGASVGGAVVLGRLRQDRTAFAALVAAPVTAALLYAGVAALAARPSGPNEAAATPATSAGAATPVAASPPPAVASVPAQAPAPESRAASGASSAAGAAPLVGAERPMSGVGGGSPAVRPGGPKAEALRTQAEQLRLAKRFAESRDAYAKLVKLAPQDADAWADLADASAAAAGGDLKAGAAAIDKALLADPDHVKALWLKASLELQEKRYTTSMELWHHLLGQLPAGSDDARIVSANLAETRALAAREGAKP